VCVADMNVMNRTLTSALSTCGARRASAVGKVDARKAKRSARHRNYARGVGRETRGRNGGDVAHRIALHLDENVADTPAERRGAVRPHRSTEGNHSHQTHREGKRTRPDHIERSIWSRLLEAGSSSPPF